MENPDESGEQLIINDEESSPEVSGSVTPELVQVQQPNSNDLVNPPSRHSSAFYSALSSFSSYQDASAHLNIGKLQILLFIISAVMQLLDTSSDAYIAYVFSKSENKRAFWTVLIVLLVTSTVNTVVCLYWAVCVAISKVNANNSLFINIWQFVKIAIVLLQFGPFYHKIKKVVLAIKVRKEHSNAQNPVSFDAYNAYLSTATDCSMLMLIESFMEAAPQLLVQLHSILSVFLDGANVLQEWRTIISVAFSLASISMCLVLMKTKLTNTGPLLAQVPSFLLPFIWRSATILARIISISALIIYASFSTALPAIGHIILTVLNLIFLQQYALSQPIFISVVIFIVCIVIHLFAPYYKTGTVNFLGYYCSYSIQLVEDFCILTFALVLSDFAAELIYITVMISLLYGIGFLCLYYYTKPRV